MSTTLLLQAYSLKLLPHPAPFSVVKFEAREALSELYRYEIDFTCAVAGLPMDQVLGRPAEFIIDPVDPATDYLRRMFGGSLAGPGSRSAARTVHGIVTGFEECGTSADETLYRVMLEPRLADQNRGVTSRLFQQQSVPEIIAATLKHHGYREGVDFNLNLTQTYGRREYVTQYHETTVAFIQRIAADEGIWFRFEQKKDGEVVIFGDDPAAYAYNQRMVPLRADAGLESTGAEAITALARHMRRVPEAVRLHEYNHRQAGVSLLVEQNVARDDTTTDAVDYHWGEHYGTPEEGERIARLRHEAHLAGQLTYSGTGNPFSLEAGEVMLLDRNPADAPHGLLVTSVESGGGRSETFSLRFTAIPADRVWRPEVNEETQPSIDGILPARVTSPGNYQYAYLTKEGWYVVVLPFDLDEWSPGGTSRPVRFAKAYSGDTYGHHFPLIDGAEVALVFTNGDPDRPVIIGAMHDSVHPDLVTNLNNTRNLIRTAAQNEMRMEDKRGIEHVHLMTPFQTSELNLGHMVDAERKERGQGAELRTDGHVAVRGGKGVLVTAEGQPGAAGQKLAMQDGNATLEQAEQILRTLNDSANAAKALQADIEQQRALIQQKLTGLQKPVIVATAPAGVGVASGEHMQLAARNQMFITAGDGLDIGVMKRLAVAVGETISLFAARLGIRIFAAKGKVQVQAQGDAMELMSMKDMTISSSDGEAFITARKGVTIGDGAGAYIKLSGGKITVGSPAGEIELRGSLTVNDPDGGNFKFPSWSSLPVNEITNAKNFGFSE